MTGTGGNRPRQWAPKRKEEAKDNYVNLLGTSARVVLDAVEEIQRDDSGISMSFNNPNLNEKEVSDLLKLVWKSCM